MRPSSRASGQSHVPERHFCRQHLGDKVIGNVGQFHRDLFLMTFRGEHLDARGLKAGRTPILYGVAAEERFDLTPGVHYLQRGGLAWEPAPPVVSSLPDFQTIGARVLLLEAGSATPPPDGTVPPQWPDYRQANINVGDVDDPSPPPDARQRFPAAAASGDQRPSTR